MPILDTTQFTDEYVKALSDLCEEPIVDELSIQSAKMALLTAWENVRFEGSSQWTLESAPRIAVTIMLTAAARGWQNIGGYVNERADTVTLERYEDYAKGAELTDTEKSKLHGLVHKNTGKNSFTSMRIKNESRPEMRSAQRSNRFIGFDFRPYGETISPQQSLPIPGLPEDLMNPNRNIEPYPWGHKDPTFLRKW